jgi:hypothetical protein
MYLAIPPQNVQWIPIYPQPWYPVYPYPNWNITSGGIYQGSVTAGGTNLNGAYTVTATANQMDNSWTYSIPVTNINNGDGGVQG